MVRGGYKQWNLANSYYKGEGVEKNSKKMRNGIRKPQHKDMRKRKQSCWDLAKICSFGFINKKEQMLLFLLTKDK